MPTKNLSCQTGLAKNIIKKSVFDREVALCEKLSHKNKGKCGWGKCKDCGVVFLLYKLHKGELIEDKDEIGKVRKSILSI